ncbi:YcaO-like family protein [Sulfurovum sp. zt1-1]|uniref:YcaO-like family protein n=1 Tax=Sulfurovum zhangzhouensis TaxID=3019067 RepID=A0ABT7QZJ1_9BACT|nr:YcaO-like family protein [Sulfurovum zhangzhouensis]MDM5272262.1 YcaO-like family protein [Sulfurovum zhangzhouensis]
MNLLSKTAPVETSIEKMKAALKDAGSEPCFSQEKNPLKHCFSVNLASVEAPRHIYSNGKGINSLASMASALGEYIERLQTNTFFNDFYLPERKIYPDEVAFEFGGKYLNDSLHKFYDPDGEVCMEDLLDFNSDHDSKIVALPFIQPSTNEKVYFPLNILNNLYVSNGLATGNTPQEAQVQALSEIFERHAKLEIIKNGYALPSFPDDVLASFERVYGDVIKLRELGYRVEVLDASLGGEFPVTAISLINPKNASLFVSFGAHPILEVSLERTMTELMQGRGLDDLDAFEKPTFDMSLVSSSFNLESHYIDSTGKLGFGFLSTDKSFDYAPWVYQGEGTEDELRYLKGLLDTLGKEMYLREYDYLGFYSCQVIVPGFSEVYPVEDLVYNNKNTGKQIRDMILHFDQYDPEDILDAVEPLDDSINVEAYIGVIFEHSFTMADLKAQLYLLVDERENALMLLEMGSHPVGRIVAELIRMEEAQLPFEAYEEAFNMLYLPEDVQKARRVLALEELMIDTTLHVDYLRMLELYDRLTEKKSKILG